MLTAFNDNALITYLATLVPNLDDSLKFAVVEGAVAGGGLTVIANAPNPAGQALLAASSTTLSSRSACSWARCCRPPWPPSHFVWCCHDHYDFDANLLDGTPVSLDEYRGRVTLVVNVASHCGYTPADQGLEALYRRHKDEGFVVLGFPCNQFGAQEPGTSDEIASFCSRTYDVTFPIFAKVDVNGADEHPLFAYLSGSVAARSAPSRSSGTSPSSWWSRRRGA